MDPLIWGHDTWIFLIKVVMGYPINPNYQDIQNYMRFFIYLQYVLPCMDCALHYSNNLNIVPIEAYLNSRDNLLLWLLKMCNLVRQKLGKKLFNLNSFINYYLGHQSNNSDCSMNPATFGLDGWKFFYSVAYSYPLIPTYQDIMNYKNFFTYVQYVLPCESYRKQYVSQLNELDISPFLSTQSYLFQWVLAMQNMINKQVNRPALSLQDIFSIYFNHQWGSNKDEQPPFGLGLIEKFTDLTKPHNISLPIINWKDPNLFKKNVSMAILVALSSLYLIK